MTLSPSTGSTEKTMSMVAVWLKGRKVHTVWFCAHRTKATARKNALAAVGPSSGLRTRTHTAIGEAR